MEIKEQSTRDKLYNNILWIILAFILIIVAIFSFWSVHSKTMDKLEAQAKKEQDYKQKLLKKINDINSTKPKLVCKDKLFLPESYDLMKINDKYFIVTEETISKPNESLSIDDCEIYIPLTNTMKPKPKIVVPIDIQHKNQVDNLSSEISTLELSISNYRNQQAKYQDTLDKANGIISDLRKLVTKQDKELYRLAMVEAKYKEVKTLLTIVVEKKDIKLKDLIVKEKKPKPVVVKVDKVLDKSKKKLTVDLKSPIIPKIINTEEYIKRQIYVIKQISMMRKNSSTHIDKFVKRPSLRDLESIQLTLSQLDNVHIKSQFDLTITNLVRHYSLMFKVNEDELRQSIRNNVGV